MALGTAMCHRHAIGTRMAQALRGRWSVRLSARGRTTFRTRPVPCAERSERGSSRPVVTLIGLRSLRRHRL